MKKVLIILAIGASLLLADSNDTNSSKEKIKIKTEIKIQTEIEKQIEKEKKYAKEKTFYQGKEYDLKSYEIDPNALSKIPSLEPDDDFDMSKGVYTD